MIRRQWGEDGMYKSAHGEWVLYAEAQAEIERLNKACDQRAAHEYKLMGEVAALKAQNAELLAAQQWQPIESAPKDEETPYLVLLPKNDVAPFLTMQVTNFQGQAYPDILNGMIDRDDAVTEATHWMSLPPPIAKARGESS